MKSADSHNGLDILRFMVLGSSSGIYKFRKSGDIAGKLFTSSSGKPLTVQLAVASSSPGALPWKQIS